MRPRGLLAFGNFFSVAHFYLIIFILAPYLTTFMPAEETGLVISAGALATLSIFPSVSRLVARYGPRRLALFFGIAEAIVLVLLAVNPLPVLAIIFAALACAISPLIAYGLDILLEATVAHSEESMTGRVRTAFLTAGNAALILAPLTVGFLLDSTDAYYRVFFAAALSLLPFIVLFTIQKFPEGKPPRPSNFHKTWVCIQKSRDLYSIIFANAILQFFYHLAPLFIPLYLHNALHIPWSSLGWMFAAMLLPFVLLEYPAGVAADRWLGDKALLVAGFIITGASFAVVGLLTSNSLIFVVVAVLIATRVGAALVESMTEGHFFRRVSESDTDTVSLFRMMRPLAALFAPLIGSILLATGGYFWLFIITGGAILFCGVAVTIGLKEITPEDGKALETFEAILPAINAVSPFAFESHVPPPEAIEEM